MATTIYFRPTYTTNNKSITGTTYEILTANTGVTAPFLTYTTTTGGTEVGNVEAVDAFISERFASATPLTGNVTFSHYATASVAGLNTTLRLKLSRVLRGGTLEEREIGTYDGAAAIPLNDGAVHKQWVFALPAVTVEAEERLIARIYAVPVAGQTMQAGGNIVVRYGNASLASQTMRLIFDTTFTVLPNVPRMHFKNTTNNAIGGFKDMSLGAGTSTQTAVVNTQTGTGLEIPWTLTGGGAAAEWISGRLSRNFSMGPDPSVDQAVLEVRVTAFESATQANVGIRVKVSRYRDGTEMVFCTISHASELGTTAGSMTLNTHTAGASYTPADFQEDDRIVVRFYAISIGTMASTRTATINYNTTGTTGNYLSIVDLPALKAEGDPAASWTVPDGQSTLGVGN